MRASIWVEESRWRLRGATAGETRLGQMEAAGDAAADGAVFVDGIGSQGIRCSERLV